jgi:hypothetical protein
MSGLASSVWNAIVKWQTGRDATDGFTRDKYESRIKQYNSHFDRSLSTNKEFDKQKDAEKIKERVADAQNMTNQYYDLATEFYEYGQ